jgi:hypothetical protein
VEVTFEEAGRSTRVVLVHSDWEKAADPAARDRYDTGWVKVFEENYAGACQVAA